MTTKWMRLLHPLPFTLAVLAVSFAMVFASMCTRTDCLAHRWTFCCLAVCILLALHTHAPVAFPRAWESRHCDCIARVAERMRYGQRDPFFLREPPKEKT